MGKILDLVIAVFVVIIFLYVMYKLNITAGDIWTFFKHFLNFSGPSPTNTTASFVGFQE